MSNQRREGRQRIVLRPNIHTVLCGFSPDFGVYAAWEARRHHDFAYSRNVQVREPLLEEAQATGWAVANPRRVRGGLEVRVAFTPGNIARFIQLSRLADRRGLDGEEREAFFLSQGAWAPGEVPVTESVQQLRTRVIVSRLQRDPAFRGKINIAFNSTCAVCGVQLKIIHAAHIRPVDEEGSTDDVWNGLALCPNHHALFDARLLFIGPDLRIRIDESILDFLRRQGRGDGADDLLLKYQGLPARPPVFWRTDMVLRRRMQQALQRRTALLTDSSRH